MVYLIAATGDRYFRWQDSGDLQSVEQLRSIVHVCRALPRVKFWLPTREYRIVTEYLKMDSIPSNLVIRMSAHMVNANPPSGYGLPTSTVHTEPKNPVAGIECKAYKLSKNGKATVTTCGRCRACWDVAVENVSYLKHT